MRKALAAAGCVFVAVLAAAAPAGAAVQARLDTSTTPDTLYIEEQPGTDEASQGFLSYDPIDEQLTYQDAPGVDLTVAAATPVCATSATSGREQIDCAFDDLLLVVDMGDLDDSFGAFAGFIFTTAIRGGAGNDSLAGTESADDMAGGEGTDTIYASDGPDRLDGETLIYSHLLYDPEEQGVSVTLDGLDNDGAPEEHDNVSGATTIIGGIGPDRLSAAADGRAGLVLEGRGGADVLTASPAGSVLRGGDGDDRLHGGLAGDTLDGGEGMDASDYSGRTASVTVDLAAGTGGQSGETDTIAGIEQVDGGSGPDILRGSGGAEALNGGDGDDRIDGQSGDDVLSGGGGSDALTDSGGTDTFRAGNGDDSIASQDGVSESVDCGEGTDRVTPDPADVLSGCEIGGPQADGDGDGAVPPQDCDDSDPSRRPGATDVPANGIDEDCSGADAALVLSRLDVAVVNRWLAYKRGSRITRLRLRSLPGGTRVEVRCRGRRPKSRRARRRVGCPFAVRRYTVRRARKRLDLTKPFRRRLLLVGTRLELRILNPNFIGKVVRYRVRRDGVSPARQLCLPPGASKPRRC